MRYLSLSLICFCFQISLAQEVVNNPLVEYTIANFGHIYLGGRAEELGADPFQFNIQSLGLVIWGLFRVYIPI